MDALDLVLPQRCAGCDDGDNRLLHGLCPLCALAFTQPAVRWHKPTPCPVGMPALTAASSYSGAVRKALLAHKEDGRLVLVVPLGTALAAAVAVAVTPAGPSPTDVVSQGPLCLVPIPSARSAVRSRGHDHALRLARSAASLLTRAGLPSYAEAALVPARRVADQSGLDRTARRRNLTGALQARPPPAVQGGGSAVVIVDDVVTTGATLVEAARALGAAGYSVRAAAVVAATQRRSRPADAAFG